MLLSHLTPNFWEKYLKIFWGAYNPETKESARKDSGSFYTPREIVNYMVNESLITYLKNTIDSSEEAEIRSFVHIGDTSAFSNVQKKKIIDALKTVKILDPACGSGAFPMGILNKLVELIAGIEGNLPPKEVYNLKLELIENCIYGIDIQNIAVQISKLRFFISLICDQQPTDNISENYGFAPLPNLVEHNLII